MAAAGFEIGLIGLGKMGGNMRERLRKAGLTVVGYDRNQEISDATSLADWSPNSARRAKSG